MSQKHGMFDDSSEEDIAKKRFRNWLPRLRSRNPGQRLNLNAQRQRAEPVRANAADAVEDQAGPSHATEDDADESPAVPPHAVHGEDGNREDLFKNPSLVYENDAFKIFVQKKHFSRQKKFSLDDHLYLLKIEQKSNSKTLPFLKDIINILDTVLSHILNEMRQFYQSSTKEETNVVYITIKQPNMVSAIRSEGMNLKSPSEAIVKHVLSSFYIFSQSQDNLRLEKEFNIYFKVLSHENVATGSKRRKAYLNSRLGCNETYFIKGGIEMKEIVK